MVIRTSNCCLTIFEHNKNPLKFYPRIRDKKEKDCGNVNSNANVKSMYILYKNHGCTLANSDYPFLITIYVHTADISRLLLLAVKFSFSTAPLANTTIWILFLSGAC